MNNRGEKKSGKSVGVMKSGVTRPEEETREDDDNGGVRDAG